MTRPRPSSTLALDPLTASWIEAIEATHDERTAHEYDLLSSKWADRWKTLGEIGAAAIADYQRDRLREVSRETVRKNCVALRMFFSWCVEQGKLVESPEIAALPKKATGTRARAKVVRTPLSHAEAKRVIARLPVWNTTSPKHVHHRARVRDWAKIAWETALRPSTIAKLRSPEHFKKGDKSLHLTADIDKARYARAVPLSITARKALTRCLPDEPGLIFGFHDFRELLEAASSKAKLGRVVRPYDLRHSRITAWVRSGADLLGVQHLAGHRDLSTTARYARPSAEAARKIVSRSKSA